MWSGLYPSQKHLAWLLCSGIINGRLAAAKGVFTRIRPIPLSCAFRNSAFGLQVMVISRRNTTIQHTTAMVSEVPRMYGIVAVIVYELLERSLSLM